MAIPTISLALIAKNEEKNIRRMLASFEGCCDEIILVDTGSTDKTKEVALELGCKVYDFEWINSFSQARNFALSKCTQEYVLWADLDDVLRNKDGFLQWKQFQMPLLDMAFADYNYALDEKGQPIITFIRERVFKRSLNPQFQYDIHEGVIPHSDWKKDIVHKNVWAIDHLRDADDIKADRSRNLKILEEIKSSKGLDARLEFYYGKELYEFGKVFDAVPVFEKATKNEKMEFHDKILSYQYAAYSCIACSDQLDQKATGPKQEFFAKALGFAYEGLKVDPNRAEFHVIIGDIYLKTGEIHKAIPHYSAAKSCFRPKDLGLPFEGAIYSFVDCYGSLPSMQLAKIYLHMGKIKESRREAILCWKKYKTPEAKLMLDELAKIAKLINLDNGQEQTEDIVFSCPPMQAYPFDEEIYKTKPLGGSETALVSMAKYLKKITNRPVKVFNVRDEELVSESGVEYISNRKLNEYMSKNRPKVHIAWRHNIKMTKSPNYLWCHDLITPTVESGLNQDKIMALSEFHKNYIKAKQGVGDDKFFMTRNGLNPEKFNFVRRDKNPNKVVWMSSPDRGLDRCMLVCDEIHKDFPDLELHVYYGTENLYKYGLGELADQLHKMMKDRPYVKYHGFVEQNKMYHEVSDAVLWLHPCNFIESFCITALEMLELGIYPITRKLGALENTLADAEKKGQAILLDHDCVTKEEINAYAEAAKYVLKEKKWEIVNLDIEKHSWKSIATEWIKEMQV